MKKIVRYLKKTIEINLIFGQESTKQPSRDLSLYKLVDYIENNFARDLED